MANMNLSSRSLKTMRNVKKYSGEAILLSQSAANPEVVDRGGQWGGVCGEGPEIQPLLGIEGPTPG